MLDRIISGTVLGSEGRELKKGVWESCVYLGPDNHVYQISARNEKGSIKVRVLSKRTVGEYLRWVDGLFRPGEIPSATTGVHYRAARYLRELL